MKETERACNIALGLSVLSWSVMGLMQPLNLPRIAIAMVNAVVGALLIFRSPQIRAGSLKAIFFALPGVVVAGIALKLSGPLERWPWTAQAILCAGAALTVAAFFWLGRSFAILPSLRAIVSGGPYGLIRHPAYAGELVMISACVVARPTWIMGVLIVAALPLVVLRILVEEHLLRHDQTYVSYTERVKYRLAPRLW